MDIDRFMTQADAMITDYSSIFYNFLLLDRPIGFTEDDIDAYGNKRGFAVDPDKFRPGERLHTTEDICEFAKSIAEGKDEFKIQRGLINDKVNKYKNGNYSKRVLDIMQINIQ